MLKFRAQIDKIDINPFVYLPSRVLNGLFLEAGRDKSPIRVKGTIDGHSFTQTLVKFRGAWRLYINAGMLKAAGKTTGQKVSITIMFNAERKQIPFHPGLKKSIEENKKAAAAFNKLSPALKEEMLRYIFRLKTETAVERNIQKAVRSLEGKEKFAGRYFGKP